MKIVACVPIKLKNERLPGKNTKPFDNGIPLIEYIQRTLIRSEVFDEIFVYCSNESIKDYLLEGVTFLKRDISLDRKDTNSTEILDSFLKKVDADIYVNSHATSPFLKPNTIRNCVMKIIQEGYDSALTVTKLQDFAWFNGNPLNYNPTKIPRTQDLDPLFVETSGVYAFKKEVFLKLGRKVGLNPYFSEVSKIESMDIDYPEDFEIANSLLTHLEKGE